MVRFACAGGQIRKEEPPISFLNVINPGSFDATPGIPNAPCFLPMALFYYVLSVSFVCFFLLLLHISPVYSEHPFLFSRIVSNVVWHRLKSVKNSTRSSICKQFWCLVLPRYILGLVNLDTHTRVTIDRRTLARNIHPTMNVSIRYETRRSFVPCRTRLEFLIQRKSCGLVCLTPIVNNTTN
jgi:hypothetical protein